MTARTRWIAAIVALLLGNAVGVAVLIVASGDPSARVVPDAYQRGLELDQTMAVMQASAELGWRADARLAALDGSHDQVAIDLTDGAGAPLTGAHVEVAVRHASRATGAVAVLQERTPGHYTGAIDPQGHGLHEVDVKARRGPEHFAASREVERKAGP